MAEHRPLFHHVILTPFNCARSRNPNEAHLAFRSRPGWIEERFELFERYCLPSVLAQTSQDFLWMIYFDRSTAGEYLERAQRGLAGRTNCFINLCNLYGSETVQADLAKGLDPSLNWLVTTRLDNDDGLHHDFVRALHAEVCIGREEALDFPWGIVYANGVPYLSRQKCNAFISLSEPMENLRTVLSVRHKEMARRYPVREIGKKPIWLQSVHGSNVGNKIRGWRIAHAKMSEGFDIGEKSPSDTKTNFGISVENATLGVGRLLRDRLADTWNTIKRPPWVIAP